MKLEYDTGEPTPEGAAILTFIAKHFDVIPASEFGEAALEPFGQHGRSALPLAEFALPLVTYDD
jgi:hypothetical protein